MAMTRRWRLSLLAVVLLGAALVFAGVLVTARARSNRLAQEMSAEARSETAPETGVQSSERREDDDTSPVPPGGLRILYKTEYRGVDQVRVRVLPPEGDESVLWHTPPSGRIRCVLPSPSYDRVAIFWDDILERRTTRGDTYFESQGRVSLIDIATREAEEIAWDLDIEFLFWRDDHMLSLLTPTRSEGGDSDMRSG